MTKTGFSATVSAHEPKQWQILGGSVLGLSAFMHREPTEQLTVKGVTDKPQCAWLVNVSGCNGNVIKSQNWTSADII